MDTQVGLRGYGKPFVMMSDAYQECVARTLGIDARRVGELAQEYKKMIESTVCIKDVWNGDEVQTFETYVRDVMSVDIEQLKAEKEIITETTDDIIAKVVDKNDRKIVRNVQPRTVRTKKRTV